MKKTFLVLGALFSVWVSPRAEACLVRYIPLGAYFHHLKTEYPQISVYDTREGVMLRVPSERELSKDVSKSVESIIRVYLRNRLPLEASEADRVNSFLGRIRGTLQELITNAHEWGNEFEPSRTVTMRFEVRPHGKYGAFVFHVEDEGAGFDRENLPHAATADEPLRHIDLRGELNLRDGGFGLVLIDGHVDEIHRAGGPRSPTTVIFYLDDYHHKL